MRTFLLAAHLVGLAAFLGAIFAQIALGVGFPPDVGATAFAGALAAATYLTGTLVYAGLIVLLATGAGLLLTRTQYAQQGWMIAKLALVLVVAVNAVLVVGPTGAELSEMAAGAAAAGEPLPAEFLVLRGREDVLGLVNLLCVLAIIVLSLRKRLWR